jgi:tRNA pseudouridine38-40 synthase
VEANWRNIALLVSYDGTDFQGFQSQPQGGTIQDHLEIAIERTTGHRPRIDGSGRTDSGVHARKQIVTFTTQAQLPLRRWKVALQHHLPSSIVVVGAAEVEETFHARKSAIRKSYRYMIYHAERTPDVFQQRFQHHVPQTLNIEAMRAALPALIGTHDFVTFQAKGSAKVNTIRTLFDVTLTALPDSYGRPDRVLCLEFCGDGFLYKMVRIIAGTLLDIGLGKKQPEQMAAIIESKDRNMARTTAPAKGLILWDVEYENPLNFS